MTTSFARRFTKGTIWAGLGQFGSQASHFLVLLILAYFLGPADFGLVGLAMTYITVSQAFSNLGLAPAVVQQRNPSQEYLSTAFWANLAMGFLLGGLTVAGAEPVAFFLGDPRVQPILVALSIVFPISSIGVVPRALLTRDLKFDWLAAQQLAAEGAFGLVGATMAWRGFGVWSLVCASISQRIVAAVFVLIVVRWKPSLSFCSKSLRKQLVFGLPVMLNSLLHRGVQYLDYFVVGRWLGAEALGYYTLAFQLAVVPSQRILGILRNVAFPSFVAVEQPERIKNAFIEMLGYLFSALAPLSLLTAALAPWFILSLYGERWAASIFPMQLLALTGFFYGFDISEALFYAQGRPRLLLILLLIRVSLFGILVSMSGLAFGVSGVALSMTLALCVSAFAACLFVSRLIGVSLRQLCQPLGVPLRVVALAAIPPAILYFLPTEGVQPLIVFCGLAATMLVIILISFAPTYLRLAQRLQVRIRPGN